MSSSSDVSNDSDSEEDVQNEDSLGATADDRTNSYRYTVPMGFPNPAMSQRGNMISEPSSSSYVSPHLFALPGSPQMEQIRENRNLGNSKEKIRKEKHSTQQRGMKAQIDSFSGIDFDPQKLKAWSSQNMNAVLVFDIVNNSDGLCHWLYKEEVEFENLSLFISLLHKMIDRPSQGGTLTIFLKQIVGTRFFEKHLKDFFTQLPKHEEFEHISLWIQRIFEIIQQTLTMVEESRPVCKESLKILHLKVSHLNISSKDQLLQNIKLLYDTDHSLRLNQPTKKMKPRPRSSAPKFDTTNQNLVKSRSAQRDFDSTVMDDDDNPPDHYTQLKIFPDTEELTSSAEPFLRANKTSGPYRDLEHYLDVHSRLLREDYTEPMRRGIKDYKESLSKGSRMKEENFRFYKHVKIVKMGFDSLEGVTHFVSFDNTEFEQMKLDWARSKRLKFGSLLCFSKDNFESTIFATVAEREIKHLKKGILQVIFQNQLEDVFTISENDEFIIGETTAYFESYRHVLEGLKETTRIPLSEYILYCQPHVRPPQYLDKNTVREIQSELWAPTVDSKRWPLDKWQLEAVRLGLTKELAVIQGPPGTGKTYIGLIIMRILLKQMQSSGEMDSPILVVCYTNHALDQFLEGVLTFCSEGIVRVGGRSSSELLEPFNLVKLREKMRNQKRKSRELIRAEHELGLCRKLLKQVSRQIDSCWQDSLSMETTIVNVDKLRKEMSENHVKSLTDSKRTLGTATHAMAQWLKASSANMERFLFKAAKQHLAKCIAKESAGVPDNDSCITSEREASKLSFINRVEIYRGWLSQYKRLKEMHIQQLLLLESGSSSSEMESLLKESDEAEQNILEDSLLQRYMTNDIVYESIKKTVETEHRTEDFENAFVWQWLLGSFYTADELMDAIEQLERKTAESSKRDTIRAPKVDEGKWEISDSDNDSVDSDSDLEAGLEEIDLDDIDEDLDADQLSDLKEIKRTFQENENKEVLLLQRAQMLGISIEESDNMEEEQWQTANEMTYSKVFNNLHKAKPFTEDEVLELDYDVWNLHLPDRYRLYKYWVMRKKDKLKNTIISLVQEYKSVLDRKRKALSRKDVRILKAAKVIGMTTSGAAKNRKVLQDVGCKVIIVEEAAEVLEAHIITTLSQHSQHLILIGDHQQLRPSPTVYQLAVQCQLDVSLFERLVKNEMPHVTLCEQHRMRPEISFFMEYEYPNLTDHHSVLDYADIRGVASNVFFLQHCRPESAVEDTSSKANVHEANFLTALSLYFLQQGYESYEITILAAYGAQVQLIRSKLDNKEKGLEEIFVTSIDNYQGQENEIILLSLVRSNQESEVGFLKIDNRVCVALSRAKKGLFVIGDLKMLEKKSRFWKDVLKKAQIKRAIGVHLQLQCNNHAHTTYVDKAEDFEKKAPEGGCFRDCKFNLHCGHICPRKCHADDAEHMETLCQQPCLKKCPEGHPCELKCSDLCRPCQVLVKKFIPLCGHEDMVSCSMPEDEAMCTQTCNFKMQCGHLCRGRCGKCMQDGEHALCMEKVTKEWPCKHSNRVECNLDTAVDLCPEKCTELLNCGHKCGGTCGGCLEGKVHHVCTKKCQKPLPCGHPCNGACGTKCQPCIERCCNSCRHGQCNKKCGEPCDPCTENCAMSCYHRVCNSLCRDECQIPLCSKSCRRTCDQVDVKKCKHKCASLCGEECVCRICDMEYFTLIDFNKTRRPRQVVIQDQRDRAEKFQMTDDDILMKIPRCHHVFTLKQLDKYVKESHSEGTSFIRCPKCKNPIHGINRYDQINKRRTEKRENLKKELAKETKVSVEKLDILKASKQIVEKYCMVDEGDYLTYKEDQIDLNHALTLTMQMRFAYALKLIQELQTEYNKDSIQTFIHCKKVIAAVRDKMTPQLLSELNLELHRKLLLEEMMILDKVVKDTSASISHELKADCKVNFRDFKKGKMTTEGQERFKACIDGVYGCLESSETSHLYTEDIEDIKSRAELTRTILDGPETEDLSEILQRQPFCKEDGSQK